MTWIKLTAAAAMLTLSLAVPGFAQQGPSADSNSSPAGSEDDLSILGAHDDDDEDDRRDRRRWRDEWRERWEGRPAYGPRLFARLCGPRGERIVERMLFRLERITAPTETQRPAFDRLKDAVTRAREIAQSGCPTERPMTPTGRLAAMEKRLETMLEAIRTIRPPLEEFFGLLSEEQKARLYAVMARRHRHGAFRDWHHRRDRDWDGDRPRGERRWRDDDRRDRSEERRGRSRDDDDRDDDDRRGRGEGRDGWPAPWRGRS